MTSSRDRWLTDHEACAQLGQNIMEKVNARNRHPRGSTSYMKATDPFEEDRVALNSDSDTPGDDYDSSNIRTMMRQFSAQVNGLRESLVGTNMRYSMTQRELERRQSLLDELTTKEKQLEQAMRGDRRAEMSGRAALLDFGPSSTSVNSDPWGVANSTSDGATADFSDLSFDQVRQQQQMAIREQDEGLDVLSQVLSRQKHMALDIGNEVDVQNELIDDITDHVDQTGQRLLRETRHIKIVDRKSNVCGYWVVAILLFIAILVIAFVPYGGKI